VLVSGTLGEKQQKHESKKPFLSFFEKGGMERQDRVLLILIFGVLPVAFLLFLAAFFAHRHRSKAQEGAAVTKFKAERGALEKQLPPLASLVIGEDVLGLGADGLVMAGSLEGAPVAVKLRRPPDDGVGPDSVSAGKDSGPVGATPMSMWSAESEEDGFLANVLKEAEALRSLNHPHVLRFLGISEVQDGKVAFLFELMPRGSLRMILSNPTVALPLEDRVRLIAEIAMGMGYLHSRGVVHGSLRPSNILLSDTLQAKVADFCCRGAAEAEATLRGVEPTDKVVWCSPELLSGARISKASDVYAFGVLSWALLTRSDPYKGLPLALVVTNVREGIVSLDLKGLSGEAQWLLLSCLAFQPSARPTFETIVSNMMPLVIQSVAQG
jgi:serine/threonine protein kinase